jgi:Tfp pilus assembly protein PilN
MTTAAETAQISQLPIDDGLAPKPAPVTPTLAAKIHSGRLYLELGADYLLWGLVEKRFIQSPRSLGGAFTDSRLTDFGVQTSYVNEIIAKSEIRNGEVDLFLSLPDAMLRSFYVPIVPQNELKQVVLWEAGKVFPFGLQGELFAWRIVNSVEWSGIRKHQIQVAAVPSAKVTPICELLTAKGLTVRRVTLAALAWEPVLGNLTASAKTPAASCTAVVRLLGNRLSVFCFHRGALEFVRENTIEMSESGGEFEASLRYLDGSAPAPLIDPIAYQAVDPHTVSRMVLDNLDYYYGRFTQRTVDTIILAVPPAEHQPIVEALHESLGVPVHAAFSSAEAKTTRDAISHRLLMPVYYRKLLRSKLLDLLPTKIRLAGRQRAHFKYSLYAAALTLIAVFLVSVFQFITLGDLENESGRLQSTLDAIKNSAAYQALTTEISDQTQWQSQLAQLSKTSSEHSRILRALSNFTPPDIFLTGINIQATQDVNGRPSNSVSVAGFVADRGRYPELRLAEYLKTLVGIPGCHKVELSNQHTTISNEGKRLVFSVAVEFGG